MASFSSTFPRLPYEDQEVFDKTKIRTLVRNQAFIQATNNKEKEASLSCVDLIKNSLEIQR